VSAPYSTILCPTDLSPISDRAVAVAYSLAGPDAVVHLLHVGEAVMPTPSAVKSRSRPFSERVETPERVQERARGHMDRLVPADSLTRGVRTEVHVVRDSSVATQIISEASRLGAEVIVMASHGSTGFGRVLLGSVALDVLKMEGGPPTVIVHERKR
jgi:nucleotide-binding universal stress UspA family protein